MDIMPRLRLRRARSEALSPARQEGLMTTSSVFDPPIATADEAGVMLPQIRVEKALGVQQAAPEKRAICVGEVSAIRRITDMDRARTRISICEYTP